MARPRLKHPTNKEHEIPYHIDRDLRSSHRQIVLPRTNGLSPPKNVPPDHSSLQYSQLHLLYTSMYTLYTHQELFLWTEHTYPPIMGNTDSNLLPLANPKKITAEMCQTYSGTYDCGHTKVLVALLCNTGNLAADGNARKYMGKLCNRCILNKEAKRNQAGAGWATGAGS